MMTTTGTTNSPRLRHESKHQVSPQEDLVLAGRLRRLFPHDAHAGPEGSYRITSLYFDTPMTPPSGEAGRRGPAGEISPAVLWRKSRLAEAGEKNTRSTACAAKRSPACPQRRRRAAGRGLGLPAGAWGAAAPGAVQQAHGDGAAARTVVCYDREAFTYVPGNVRVTLDRNIRTGLNCLDFLRPERFP